MSNVSSVKLTSHWRHLHNYRWFTICTFLILLAPFLQAGIKEEVEASLKNQFGAKVNISMKKLNLSKATRSLVEKKARQRFFSDYIYAWTIKSNDKIEAYALLDNVKGLTMPITFLVVYDIHGIITDTKVMKYREPYGGEVSSANWTAQFKGRNSKSNFVVGNEIDGISGATISVYSMASGVMKLSLLLPLIQSQL